LNHLITSDKTVVIYKIDVITYNYSVLGDALYPLLQPVKQRGVYFPVPRPWPEWPRHRVEATLATPTNITRVITTS